MQKPHVSYMIPNVNNNPLRGRHHCHQQPQNSCKIDWQVIVCNEFSSKDPTAEKEVLTHLKVKLALLLNKHHAMKV
jgi:hypothetical protein